MANYMEAEGQTSGSNEDGTTKWLKQNRLGHLAQKFEELNIEIEELVDFAKEKGLNEFLETLVEEETINKSDKMRITSKIRKMLKSNDNTNKAKVVRIVLSAEEETAINNMQQRQQQITEKMQTATKSMDILSKLGAKNENELNVFRKALIKAVEQRMDVLVCKSNQEINKKKQIISAHVQKLKMYKKCLSAAEVAADALLNDANANKLKRKSKIINISEGVLQQNMRDLEVAVAIKVTVEMDTKKAIQFVNGIGNVHSYDFAVRPVPIICVKNIESTSATIVFTNMKKKEYECTVQICGDYKRDIDENENEDEKKMDNVWKQVCCVKNKNEYDVTGLEGDICYGIRAKYKSQYGVGMLCKAVTFKTSSFAIPSSILTKAETSVLLSLLAKSGKAASKGWSLLYRGSRDGFSSQIFHNKCDGKMKTLSIICSDSNNVFGGYASVAWKSKRGSVSDEDAFLFLIRSSKNYPPQIFSQQRDDSKQNAVYNHPSYMCTFGDGHDIYVHGDCNTNTNSYTYTPATYSEIPGNHYLNGNQEYFKVSEIEVFCAK